MAEEFHAQLVMRREDGRSILDSGEAGRSAAAGELDVSAERAAAVRKRLEALGFRVTAGNLNTLSISGRRDRFAETFGMEADAAGKGSAAHATKIPDELSESVADVFVPPSPEFYP
jgi:hypothetical protein